MNEPKIIKMNVFSCQACVPLLWTDEQAIALAEAEYPCGTTQGWRIRNKGDELLAGADERVPCANEAGYVHVMLDA